MVRTSTLRVAGFASAALLVSSVVRAGEATASGSIGAESTSPPAAEGSPAAAKSGLVLGVRLGFELPFGKFYDLDAAAVGDAISGVIPLWLDFGYQFKRIYVGAYGQFGFGMAKNCDAGASCEANQVRLGVDAQYHLSPTESIDPWVGLAFGYETINHKITAGSTIRQGTSMRGFEFVSAQFGLDMRAGPQVVLGPFLGASLGQFANGTLTVDGRVTNTGVIGNPAMHGWVLAGLRGTFEL